MEDSQSADEGEEFAGLVDIGPSARWRDVYAALDKHDLMVAGGEESPRLGRPHHIVAADPPASCRGVGRLYEPCA